MFSLLAQGKASWEGGIELQNFQQNASSLVDPLLPHLILRSPVPPYQNRSKSAKTHDAAVLDDGQIVLPKTFVTRKGAILLFTPSEELIITDQDNNNDSASSKHLPDIYEVGLKLGTVGNLTNTVLQFGREEEHAWEGLPVDDEKGSAEKKTKNQQAFLKFLHYLDSDVGLDKFTQPGCDQDFYLDELKSRSGINGYSTGSYAHCFGDGDDDDAISDIISEYLRCSGHHVGRKTPGLGDTEPDFLPSTLQGMESFPERIPDSTSPEHVHTRPHAVTISTYDTSSPACWSPTYMTTDPSPHRPHIAPIPPQPQSPRANPRITSAKPPPPARVLGSTPTGLQDVLHADIGRSYRRSPSPPVRFNRSMTSSPMYFASPSRGGCPEYSSRARFGSLPREGSPEYSAMTKLGSSPRGNGHEMARLENSLGKFEDYPKGQGVIDEEDEGSSVSSRWVSGRGYRPSSAGSLKSTQSTERLSKRRVSSAGASSHRARSAASRADRIASAGSSVSRQPTTASVFAHDDDLSSVQNASDPPDREWIDDSGVSGRASPARSIRVREKSSRNHSVLSNRSSDSKISRASPVMCKNSVSRVSSGGSRSDKAQHDSDGLSIDGDLLDDAIAHVSSSSFSRHTSAHPPSEIEPTRSKTSSATSQCSRINRSRLSQRNRESAATPQTDPGVWETPDGTIATLGSEADLEEVTETIKRTQSVNDGVLDDFTRDEDSPEVIWPPICEDDYGSEAEEVDIELASSRSSSIHSFGGDPEVPPYEGPSSSMDSLRPASPDDASSIEVLPERPELDEEPSHDPSPDLAFQAAILALEASYYQSPAASPLLEAPVIHEPDDDSEIDTAGRDSRFEIEKSRPSSPMSEMDRDQSISVTAAVEKYIQEGHRPQSRLSRSRQGSGTGSEEKQPESGAENEAVKAKIEPDRATNQKEIERPKSSRYDREIVQPTVLKEKEKDVKDPPSPKEPVKNLPSINLVNQDDVTKVPQPTDKEKEARRELVNSLLSQPKSTTDRGSLGLKGEGRGVEEAAKARTKVLVKPTALDEKKDKTDLSDLAALLGPPKTPKEKKSETRKKSAKPRKSAKKKAEPAPVSVDPENIDFDVFNSPEMLQHMDEELKQFVQQQGKSQPVAVDTAVANEEPIAGISKVRRTSVQTLEMPTVARQQTSEKDGAHSPSKTKKPSKKELATRRAKTRKEEKKRKEEEKKRREKEKKEREEELRLLKEREDEAAKARAEAEAKQQMMEEETARRLAEEEEARREEQEAQERLKNAKRKAREEREEKRAFEAERRRQEVQRKREEKLRREQEMREREAEAENQKLDRERRMAEVAEQRRLQAEMERLEEEQRQEEERLQQLHEEEAERRLEEERVREAEEELQRLQEERELREQMRRIAEAQAEKLRKAEEERQRLEEEERRRIEEERRRVEEEELARLREEQKRQEMARRLEAVARMRAAQQAAIRKSLLIRRCQQNQERAQNLKFTRQGQGVTRPHVFTYFVHVPRQYWELPIGYDKKNKGNRVPRRKPPPQKKEEAPAS